MNNGIRSEITTWQIMDIGREREISHLCYDEWWAWLLVNWVQIDRSKFMIFAAENNFFVFYKCDFFKKKKIKKWAQNCGNYMYAKICGATTLEFEPVEWWCL